MILFGALFALFSDRTKRSFFLLDPFLWHALLFSSFFNIAVIYSWFKFPDWMWMYFVEGTNPSILEIGYIFIYLYYLPCILGYVFARELKSYSSVLWGIFMLFLALSEAWLIYDLFDRYSVVGTHEQFLAKTAVSLFDPANPLSFVMNGSVALMVIHFVAVVYFQRKKKRTLIS